ncbi:MAG: nitrogen fixation protein NifQ [Deltaproteobacteria bacterium]|jgi:nitrogen fixation protein NifQ|nr:nitrogen fixation protein NifQ [Deltaproteobacteria bacterium]
MTGYTDTIRHWATDTRRAGTLPNPDGIGEVGLQGDEAGSRLAVRFALKVDRERVTDVRFQVFGCGFTIAACAVAAELAVGHLLAEVEAIGSQELDSTLNGLPKERGYCADLAVEALQAAVKSVRSDQTPFRADWSAAEEHGPRVNESNPVYRALMQSHRPEQVSEDDRHVFACALAAALQEAGDIACSLGLEHDEIEAIMQTFFPKVPLATLQTNALADKPAAPPRNSEVLSLLQSHIPNEARSTERRIAVWLTYILTARAAVPGHLWIAMGLFKRAQLTAAIHRHLPSLAHANHENMRWKRYLYKQVCDLNGGLMCKAPNCGVCSDYALCFAEEDEP